MDWERRASVEQSPWNAEQRRTPAVEEDPELIRHLVPLRSGDDAVLYLPRDLTPADARRIGRVVASLAMDDSDETAEDR